MTIASTKSEVGRRSAKTLAVVCPMANEGDSAAAFAMATLKQCVGFHSVMFLAVVDKASTDNTREVLEDLAQSNPSVIVVWAPENRCAVDAYVRGYKEAMVRQADWILEIDAGFSHQPEDIPQFFDQMEKGYDCVFGSRFMRGGKITEGSSKRYFVSRMGTVLSNFLLGTQLADMTSGFEMFSRRAMHHILERGIQSRAHFFQTEIKVYCRNLKIVEVPIHYKSPSPRMKSSAITDAFRQLGRLFVLRFSDELRGLSEDQPGYNDDLSTYATHARIRGGK
ncbi:MAG TPA: glycosyltransferase [Candidatus Saccharimonadales bacterium]|jgi:dolichol-phosphate mannosyltransferase|nr:glycosyltransferase [Candidatus Saccharimonadales bacterium]